MRSISSELPPTPQQPGQNPNPNKVVLLKNGSTEALSLVTATMMSLESLLEPNPQQDVTGALAFYDLAQIARGVPYTPFSGRIVKQLTDLGLVTATPKNQGIESVETITDPDTIDPSNYTYHMHDSIRNIVVSAIEGESLDMGLTNPIKKN